MFKRITILIALTTTFFTIEGYTQRNHYVVMRKRQSLGQWYYCGESFPKDQINAKWKESYRIKIANFKEKTWFIVMEKTDKPRQQRYYFNPSGQVINEKLKDGYKIEDMCLFIDKNYIKTFYVFTKISNSPVYIYSFSGEINWSSLGVDNTLASRIKDGWDKAYTCDNARSLTHRGTTFISVLMPKLSKHYPQIIEYRKEFPSDFINNKSSEGYYLSSITFDGFEKSWFVVMTKYNNNIPWAWFNFQTQQEQFLDFMNNKGYSISGVY